MRAEKADYLSEFVSHKKGWRIGFWLHVCHMRCRLWIHVICWEHLKKLILVKSGKGNYSAQQSLIYMAHTIPAKGAGVLSV